MENSSKTRMQFVFSGRVQGVGFRWRASQAASLLGLTGFVENCDDGTVLLEAQGEAEALRRLPGMLDAGTYIHIEGLTRRALPCIENERGFRVRGY